MDGALGRPDAPFEAPPGRVAGLPAARTIALGKGYMLALTLDQRIYAWGGNAAGQLGLGHLRTVESPAPVPLPHRVEVLAAGASHSLALTTTGEVMAWGSNNHGQLGQESPAYSAVPMAVALPERAQAIAAGMYFLAGAGQERPGLCLGLEQSGPTRNGWGGSAQCRRRSRNSPGSGRSPRARRMPWRWTPVHLYGWGSNASGQLGAAAKEQRHPLQLLAVSSTTRGRDV